MFSRGAHVNDRDGLTDMTLLHYAAKAGAAGMGAADAAANAINMLIKRGGWEGGSRVGGGGAGPAH